MPPQIDDRMESLLDALARHCDSDGVLLDPITAKPAPVDHYAQISTTLALYLRNPVDPLAQRTLTAWLALRPTQRDHAPFNRFLLLLLKDNLDNGVVNGIDSATIDKALLCCPIAQHYPSNNWSLLAQLCCIMEADSDKQRFLATKKLEKMLQQWMTPSGGFIDFPRKPDSIGYATPHAYHHKALFVVSVALSYTNSATLSEQLQQLLNWVMLSWDGDTHVGGFGRSTHSLFGDACLLAALLLLTRNEPDTETTTNSRIIQGIVQRWSRQTRQDGLLNINPAGERGWDNYMHLSVYNAWTVAIVSWASRHRSQSSTQAVLCDRLRQPIPERLLHDENAGLLRVESEAGMTALISTRGQPPQAFSRSRVELRYAGGLPFHVRWRDRVVIPSAAHIDLAGLWQQPSLAGWTPVFIIDESLFGLVDFESVNFEETGTTYRITLSGVPCALHRLNEAGLYKRIVNAIDWRLLNGALGRQQVFHRPRARLITAQLIISIDRHIPRITHELHIQSRYTATVRYLNPAGHALIGDALPNRQYLSLGNTTHSSTLSELRPDTSSLHESVSNTAISNARCYCLTEQSIGNEGYYHKLVLDWR